MHLTRIHIENLRSIRSLDLSLPSGDVVTTTYVVIGPNGSGKSTFLRAIASTLGGLDDLLKGPRLGAKDVSDAAAGEGKPAFIELEGVVHPYAEKKQRVRIRREIAGAHERSDGEQAPFALTALTLEQVLTGKGWRVEAIDSPEKPIVQLSPEEEAQRVRVEEEIRGDASRAPFVYLSARRDILQSFDAATLATLRHQPRVGALAEDNERFKSLAGRIALAMLAPDRMDRDGWFGRMREVLSMPSLFKSIPTIEPSDDLMPLILEHGRPRDIEGLSDGQRAILLLFAELAYRAPANGIVLIDEIEQHLHPGWQRIMLPALCAFLPTTQFIVTTHSVLISGSVPGELVFRLADPEER